MATDKISLSKTGFFALFTSLGTLLCCALPILLVMFGLGATVVAMTTAMPFLITLVTYKVWTFSISGFLLVIAGYMTWKASKSCPIDPVLAKTCARAQKWNKRILILTVLIWGVGFFTSYLLLPLTKFFES